MPLVIPMTALLANPWPPHDATTPAELPLPGAAENDPEIPGKPTAPVGQDPPDAPDTPDEPENPDGPDGSPPSGPAAPGSRAFPRPSRMAKLWRRIARPPWPAAPAPAVLKEDRDRDCLERDSNLQSAIKPSSSVMPGGLAGALAPDPPAGLDPARDRVWRECQRRLLGRLRGIVNPPVYFAGLRRNFTAQLAAALGEQHAPWQALPPAQQTLLLERCFGDVLGLIEQGRVNPKCFSSYAGKRLATLVEQHTAQAHTAQAQTAQAQAEAAPLGPAQFDGDRVGYAYTAPDAPDAAVLASVNRDRLGYPDPELDPAADGSASASAAPPLDWTPGAKPLWLAQLAANLTSPTADRASALPIRRAA